MEIRDLGEFGRGVFATRSYEIDDIIFSEDPLMSMQSHSNYGMLWTCSHCLTPLGPTLRASILHVVDVDLPLHNSVLDDDILPEPVSCLLNCGLFYCSEKCREINFEESHRLLCVGDLQKDHPLVVFKEFCFNYNEQYHMVLELFASFALKHIKTHQPLQEMIDQTLHSFAHSNWEHSKLPRVGEPFTDFQEFVIQSVDDAYYLMKDALSASLNGMDIAVYMWDTFTPQVLSKLMGLFEFNNITMQYDSPVGDAILDFQDIENPLGDTLLESFMESSKAMQQSNPCTSNCGEDTDDEYETIDISFNGVGIFSTACLINHSCDPNIRFEFSNRTSRLTVYAYKKIIEGEQLFHSYIEESNCFEDRLFEIAEYGFICKCSKCCEESNCAGAVQAIESFFQAYPHLVKKIPNGIDTQ